jgi:hypothetical protein
MVIFSPWACISRRRGRLSGLRAEGEVGDEEGGSVP